MARQMFMSKIEGFDEKFCIYITLAYNALRSSVTDKKGYDISKLEKKKTVVISITRTLRMK
jgi:hypothetical protein